MRHCASVQCRSTRRSGSAACSSARFATCSAAALSPVRYRASASRLASQPCRAEAAGELATARDRSSAATPGAWPTSRSALRASQSSIHSSTGSAGPPAPPTARSSCRATRSAGAPASARARPASRCQAERTGRGHLVVQRRPDQRMPEPQAGAGLGQHAGGARLVHRRDQVRHAAAQHDRQVMTGEIHAEQGRRPQHLAHRPGHEAEPVRDRRRQRARRGAARQLGGSRLGDGQAGAAGQRGDQLGDVERVACRPVGQPQQARRRACRRPGRPPGRPPPPR